MTVSSLNEQPDSLADFLRCMFPGATNDVSPRATTPGRFNGDDLGPGHPQTGAFPPARLLTNAALDHDYLVIPIQKAGGGGRALPVAVDPIGGPGELDILELVLAEQHARRNAETERDALADRIAQDFEELHWLRMLASTLAAGDATTDLRSVAELILPELRQLVRAEAVALLWAPAYEPGQTARAFTKDAEPDLVWSGETSISHSECRNLACQIRNLPQDRPVVFNRGTPFRTVSLSTSARNVLAVNLTKSGRHYGCLIALNRVLAADAGSDRENRSFCPPEFGSCEVGIMTTAAAMLAGQARNSELFQSEQGLRLGIIETVTGAVDARDPYTCGHSRRVAGLSTQIAARLGFSPEEQHSLYITGLMHDVGKIGIRDDILLKTGRLTDDEFDIIKQHPTIGYTILAPLQRLSFVLPGVLHHHERIDGRGYPQGLCGDEIPLDARILAVADSYDAMTSDRAYRPGMPVTKALAILKDGAGTQWDCSVVEAFLHDR